MKDAIFQEHKATFKSTMWTKSLDEIQGMKKQAEQRRDLMQRHGFGRHLEEYIRVAAQLAACEEMINVKKKLLSRRAD